MSGSRYRRGLARVRRRVRALARVQTGRLREQGAVTLRGTVRCAECGGRVRQVTVIKGHTGEIRRLHGRECTWAFLARPPSIFDVEFTARLVGCAP